MTFTRRQLPGTGTGVAVLLTLAERHPHCGCTWIVAEYSKDGRSKWVLKKQNASCPAVVFHRRLAAIAEAA